ncbi:MAG: hypothetical protein ACWA6X_03220 [Bauldia sp.]
MPEIVAYIPQILVFGSIGLGAIGIVTFPFIASRSVINVGIYAILSISIVGMGIFLQLSGTTVSAATNNDEEPTPQQSAADGPIECITPNGEAGAVTLMLKIFNADGTPHGYTTEVVPIRHTFVVSPSQIRDVLANTSTGPDKRWGALVDCVPSATP